MSISAKKELGEDVLEKFYQFLTHHSPSSVGRHLRNLLLDYLIHHHKIGLPVDFDSYLHELEDLFDLLDCAADHGQGEKAG